MADRRDDSRGQNRPEGVGVRGKWIVFSPEVDGPLTRPRLGTDEKVHKQNNEKGWLKATPISRNRRQKRLDPPT